MEFMSNMTPPNKKQKVQKPWQEIAKEAQDHRDASLAQVKLGFQDALDTLERTLENISS